MTTVGYGTNTALLVRNLFPRQAPYYLSGEQRLGNSMFKILLILLLLPSVAKADGPLPKEQSTSEAQLWLGRAMLAEVSWPTSRRVIKEQVQMAYVLKKRWKARNKNYKKESFVETLRNYCAGMGEKIFTKRQRWIRQLSQPNMSDYAPWFRDDVWIGYDEPKGFPHDWEGKYERLWHKQLKIAYRWLMGEFKDPCPRAQYWGAPYDPPKGDRMYPLKCSKRNVFYGVRR